jgi:hypothetical protein
MSISQYMKGPIQLVKFLARVYPFIEGDNSVLLKPHFNAGKECIDGPHKVISNKYCYWHGLIFVLAPPEGWKLDVVTCKSRARSRLGKGSRAGDLMINRALKYAK